MEKNVIVTDEQGHILGTTYPKRAKGLINKGRARFVCEDTICLTCPPIDLEEKKMAENAKQPVAQSAEKSNITLEYLLARMEAITSETAYIKEALDALTKQPPASAPGDIAGQAWAQAIAQVVSCREATNQHLLKFYEKVYEDNYSPAVGTKEMALRATEKAADDADKLAALSDLIEGLRHIDH